MAFSKCRQPDGRDRTWMRLCWQFCCCVHRSSHCMGKSPEFVLLINGLQKWASRQFLEMFIFAFLVRYPANRGFEVFLFVSSPILLGERGASHIRVWGQTHSYQLLDAFVSAPRRIRISPQTHSYLGADALVSGTAFVGKYKERIGRDMDWGGEILLKLGIPNYFLLFA